MLVASWTVMGFFYTYTPCVVNGPLLLALLQQVRSILDLPLITALMEISITTLSIVGQLHELNVVIQYGTVTMQEKKDIYRWLLLRT
ncbi:hypothetical protein BCV72DRAFT_98219 [Rhizopus microsporus var. microsporus]|uniref:Uncharacterized protein n=1 Tax=Rhizopus microsporus var. microsporus TaxID=86635 RepID=A0A1X0QM11_RHIZD|nr:hypothetical protein BCV72DRAFT_98219 [Rhizopus microsporus var. microsporus]